MSNTDFDTSVASILTRLSEATVTALSRDLLVQLLSYPGSSVERVESFCNILLPYVNSNVFASSQHLSSVGALCALIDAASAGLAFGAGVACFAANSLLKSVKTTSTSTLRNSAALCASLHRHRVMPHSVFMELLQATITNDAPSAAMILVRDGAKALPDTEISKAASFTATTTSFEGIFAHRLLLSLSLPPPPAPYAPPGTIPTTAALDAAVLVARGGRAPPKNRFEGCTISSFNSEWRAANTPAPGTAPAAAAGAARPCPASEPLSKQLAGFRSETACLSFIHSLHLTRGQSIRDFALAVVDAVLQDQAAAAAAATVTLFVAGAARGASKQDKEVAAAVAAALSAIIRDYMRDLSVLPPAQRPLFAYLIGYFLAGGAITLDIFDVLPSQRTVWQTRVLLAGLVRGLAGTGAGAAGGRKREAVSEILASAKNYGAKEWEVCAKSAGVDVDAARRIVEEASVAAARAK